MTKAIESSFFFVVTNETTDHVFKILVFENSKTLSVVLVKVVSRVKQLYLK